ncbi:hypothetical protein [Xanthomonas sp. XNM01]|uniref:hypothetical protein n=1 Tax=Xanthomonas sp. XNM01 TaxID=2769289 RepID=UPI00178466B8|nr:hypothetical protein [Xanthomonas sp. XNM01]MBD9369402.1 hypothetical protein [Xanthomonas sp. XNM01]
MVAVRIGSLGLAILLLAGCTTRSAGVEQRMILPVGAQRHEMADHQAFVFPAPDGNQPPDFPKGYAPSELPPTTLCASLVVERDGSVRDVALLDDPQCASAAQAPALAAAVTAALADWRFYPALLCTYPDAATRERDWTPSACTGGASEARAVAVTLAYAFTFEVRQGRRRVGAARMER